MGKFKTAMETRFDAMSKRLESMEATMQSLQDGWEAVPDEDVAVGTGGPPTSGKSSGGGTTSWDGRVAGAADRLEAMVPGVTVGSFPRVSPCANSPSLCFFLS